MPPLPPVPNVLKLVLSGVSSTTSPFPWANVLHFQYTGPAPTGPTLAAWASQMATNWNSMMGPECPSTTALKQVTATDLTSNTAGEGIADVNFTGSRGDDEIPANAAFLISYPVAVRFRGGHPRTYLMIGGNADFADASHWSAAFTAEGKTHWQSFISAVMGNPPSGNSISAQCAVSYIDKELNPVPPFRRTTPLVYPFAPNTLTASSQIASQRRRIGRRRK